MYVGGYFTLIGGETRSRIAAIDATTGIPTSWDPGGDASVDSLALSGEVLYAGGGFQYFGGDDLQPYFAQFGIPAPTLLEVSPLSGEVGAVVTVTGYAFGTNRGTSYVSFGPAKATSYVSWTNDQVRCRVPSGATSGPVTVTTGGGTSNGIDFTMEQSAPTLSSITPSGAVNDGIVDITDLKGTSFQAGATVKLNKAGESDVTATNVNVVSNTKITCKFNLVGAALGAWNVQVENPDGKSAAKQNAFTVTQAPSGLSTWYLAEGSTSWGFDCYISIENPEDEALDARITYMTDTGEVDGGVVNLPAESQTTVNPSDVLGAKDFSTRVECLDATRTIAVDRTMAWSPAPPIFEAHNSVGVTGPATDWYLPEGSSNWGFECWLLIQNPNATDVTATVTYMIEGEGPVAFDKEISANSRRTFNMADDIGARDASIQVHCGDPVIPERAMYKDSRRMGHDSIGTTEPNTEYYLAEGTTGWGFTTYVLIQNPNDAPTDVVVIYNTTSGPVNGPAMTMPANSRQTIRVNDYMPDTDFSTSVFGTAPIIAERAMYWDNGTGEAGHDSIGMPEPHTAFFLPDGEAGGEDDGVETWTLIQNPNDEGVEVRVTYFLNGGGTPLTFTDTVGANSRKTYNMADELSERGASVQVECLTAGKKIMVERAMYWANRTAGTDTIGGFTFRSVNCRPCGESREGDPGCNQETQQAP
ncbi:MAG: IPT/TIG domain-containing protein [Actinobacteria bacterium]|nr:IPT/TIG domain-containing protein [Actinomycetota bacterium]MBU1943725.1 IPT/TIG domain-containing protein [Actinomycetota bacterium]MBU2687059.1 IPT/TIG domain-containing protein [Actinomycetota bacterium]